MECILRPNDEASFVSNFSIKRVTGDAANALFYCLAVPNGFSLFGIFLHLPALNSVGSRALRRLSKIKIDTPGNRVSSHSSQESGTVLNNSQKRGTYKIER